MSYQTDWKLVLRARKYPADLARFVAWISEGAMTAEQLDGEDPESRKAIAQHIFSSSQAKTLMDGRAQLYGERGDCCYASTGTAFYETLDWDDFIDDVIAGAANFDCDAAYAHVGEEPGDEKTEYSDGALWSGIERTPTIFGLKENARNGAPGEV